MIDGPTQRRSDEKPELGVYRKWLAGWVKMIMEKRKEKLLRCTCSISALFLHQSGLNMSSAQDQFEEDVV